MDQWIDVEEHIPETDDDVLVWQKDYIYGDCDNTWEHFGIAHYSHEYNLWMGDWIEGKTTVLYWRELPKAPKKQRQNLILWRKERGAVWTIRKYVKTSAKEKTNFLKP